MGKFLAGFVLPSLLLSAALINWSLISLIDLIAFLLILYNVSQLGFHIRRRFLLLWPIVIFSVVAILSQVTYLIIWAVKPMSWSIPDASWAKLIGLMIVQSWKSPYVIYFLVIQLLALLVALVDIYGKRHFLKTWQDPSWGHVISITEHLGSHLRVASCLLLPAIQLVVGISHPSWASLPFFIGSCVGLVDWSLTSNFLGLFRWWRLLQLYAGFTIFLLYIYQLPMELPSMIHRMADLIGLYKISANSEWPKICSSISLMFYYIMLSFSKSDLEEMGFIISRTDCSLTEQLLPSKHSFFIRESRSGVRHTNVLLRGAVFRTFSINFFTYGFPISLQQHNYIQQMGFPSCSGWEWQLRWRRDFMEGEVESAVNFLEDIQICGNQVQQQDSWKWLADPSGIFTVGSAYRYFNRPGLNVDQEEVFKVMWKVKIPSKASCFAWRLFWDRLPTKMNLQRRNIDLLDTLCPFCRTNNEEAAHLFVSCDRIKPLWGETMSWRSISGVFSEDPKEHFRQFGFFYSIGVCSHTWLIWWIALTWTIWRHRNRSIFQNESFNNSKLMEDALFTCWTWLRNLEKGFDKSFQFWSSSMREAFVTRGGDTL